MRYDASSLTPTTVRVVPMASPLLQPSGTVAASGTVSPPANGCATQRPTSSPVGSSNHTTRSPSAVSSPCATPMATSVTCRGGDVELRTKTWYAPGSLPA
jgi:hypothetical protein